MYERVMVFVDGSNMFHAMRRIGLRIDYRRLVDQLVGNRKLVVAYYYSAKAVPQSQTQSRFHKSLEYEGFRVITRPVKVIRKDLWVEKGVDLALAIDMLVNAFRDLFDTAVLVSGDEDFAPLLAEIKRLRKRVEVAAFESEIGRELKIMADRYIALDNLRPQIHLDVRENKKGEQ